MNRKELYAAIKADEKFLAAARCAAKGKGFNWTCLPDSVLEAIVNTPKKENKTACKKATCKKTVSNKCTDEGARKAILAIAKILNLKNIERNFN